MGAWRVSVASFPDVVCAEVMAALLRAQNLPAVVSPADMVSGPLASATGGAQLLIWPEDIRRALWFLQVSECTEAELVYLATGEFGKPATDEAQGASHHPVSGPGS